jgi:uncharacterized protein YodC (DUF2158 family)
MIIGDVVSLKSGGPIMTIVFIYDGASQTQNVKCKWFNDLVLNEGDFPIDALTISKDQDKK